MPELIELEVATPERLMVKEQVAEVQLPGKDGYLGILPGHAPLLGQLGTGVLTYVVGSKRHTLAVHGGFLEILPDHLRVLADLAERAEDIDVNRARAELGAAQAQLGSTDPAADPAVAMQAVASAEARIAASEQK